MSSFPRSGATLALNVFSGLLPSAAGGIIQRAGRGSLKLMAGLPGSLLT